jgi:hypothetical protein
MKQTVQRSLIVVLSCVVGLLLAEAAGQILIHRQRGYWLYHSQLEFYQRLFERHPWLVMVPRRGASMEVASIDYSINSLGFRGREYAKEKAPGIHRIICYGGSTTFCTGLSNEDAWPTQIEKMLGSGYEVWNKGAPGYTTAENVIQTALQQFDYAPDIAIYYEGWNDAQSMHVDSLEQDYSDFHGRLQLADMQFDGSMAATKSALMLLIFQMVERLVVPYPPYNMRGQVQDGVDPRALAIYEYNLRSLVAICRAHKIRVLLVPQVMNDRALTSDRPYGWLPYVPDKDLPAAMKAYAQAMRKVATEQGALFVDPARSVSWTPEDFIDQGHFTRQGATKFATVVSQAIR